MDYSRFLNKVSKARKPTIIRSINQMIHRTMETTGTAMISLAEGLPNPDQFPIQEATFKLKDGSNIQINAENMKTALQYGPTPGMACLREWIWKFIREFHDPPLMGQNLSEGALDFQLTAGAAEAYAKTLEMVVCPGDNVLVESPCYTGLLSWLGPQGCNLLGVETDDKGIIPDNLRQVLSRWSPEDATNPNSDIPKLLYTVPVGGNPRGTLIPLERKKEIYKIAQEYDLLILEDDPYYFLQYSDNKSLLPSFLSMDTDGRVLRCESFSKIISSGIRLGYLVGPAPLVNVVKMSIEVSSEHTSMLSQMLLAKLFEHWGMDGFKKHVRQMALFYRSQREKMQAAATKWLTGLAEWTLPDSGFYFWIRLKGIPDARALIEQKVIPNGIVMVPGSYFLAEPDTISPYMRLCFSKVDGDTMMVAFESIAKLCKEQLEAQKSANSSK